MPLARIWRPLGSTHPRSPPPSRPMAGFLLLSAAVAVSPSDLGPICPCPLRCRCCLDVVYSSRSRVSCWAFWLETGRWWWWWSLSDLLFVDFKNFVDSGLHTISIEHLISGQHRLKLPRSGFRLSPAPVQKVVQFTKISGRGCGSVVERGISIAFLLHFWAYCDQRNRLAMSESPKSSWLGSYEGLSILTFDPGSKTNTHTWCSECSW